MSKPFARAVVERDGLAPALVALARIAPTKNTIPALSNILVRGRDDGIAFYATDLDRGLEIRLAAETEGAAFDVTAPAGPFREAVQRTHPGAQIELTQEAADGPILLRAGRMRVKLPTLPASQYPEPPTIEEPASFRLPSDRLATILARVEHAQSRDETKYFIQGVHLHVREDGAAPRLAACATDGKALALAMTSFEPQGALPPGVTIPTVSVAEILRLLPKEPREVLLEITERGVRLAIGSWTFVSAVINATFPDYQRVIPCGNERKALVDRGDMEAAIARAMIAAEGEFRGVGLAFSGDTLRISATATATGLEAADEIACDWAGEALQMKVSAKMLTATLGKLDGDDVQLCIGDAGDPVLIDHGETMTAVIMPMRF